ncbi:MAG TPA: homocysteine S-methyltransferase family protein [Solirubrobacterales bacterium]|jgi:homocysteine S-methyltransferase|nr:homocysteine S-methyltransferase family protein [Solirubrobacterales bacterium]
MSLPDGERLFIGDGGLETTMIFREGFELPEFASFTLLAEPAGREALRRYYGEFIAIARRHGAGFTLDTPTWRASGGWGEKLGYSPSQVADVNRDAVEFAVAIGAEEEGPETPIAICGVLGPQGDAYHPETVLGTGEAASYHAAQVETLAAAGVDMVAAYTLTYAEEAIGIADAAGVAGIPVSISFTVETDGRLPSGEALGEAIERVDAETSGAAAYFMINCAHPSHFAGVIDRGGPWLRRLGGIRANASRMSHEQLDDAEQLDDGDPVELALEYRAFEPRLPALRVLGGCCGTDSRHIAAICDACLPAS